MLASFVRLAAIAGVLIAAGMTTSCSRQSPSAPSAPPAAPSTPPGPGGITVTTVSPSGGAVTGGTMVTLFGSGFEFGARVTFGGGPTDARVNSSTTIVVTTPPHAEGTVDVVVINPDGRTGVLPRAYAYRRGPDPFAVLRMTPQPGSTAGGSPVTIESVGVQSGASVDDWRCCRSPSASTPARSI